MGKELISALEEFDEFAERGRRVVAHYSDPKCLFPRKREQALKIVLLGQKIAKLVVLDSRAGQKPNRGKTVSPVQRLQSNYVSILQSIGGRARASDTGFKLSIPITKLLQLTKANLQASRLLRKYERRNAKPVPKKKIFSRRKK